MHDSDDGDDGDNDERRRIPITRETLEVGTRVVETGRVRIVRRPVEEQRSVEAPLVRERVVIERVPVERIVDPDRPPEVRAEGDVLVIPVLEEELVLEKRLVLREELRVSRLREETRVVEEVALRRDEISIERIPAPAKPSAKGK
jgi:uncharacterized protein (TIGR02271 family)